MDEVVITKAAPDDAEAICDVLTTTWLDTYPNPELGITESDIRYRLEGENGERIAKNIEWWRENIRTVGPNYTMYVARIEDKVVGMTSAGIDTTNNRRSVMAVYVLPEAQGIGAGAKLMQAALDWLGDTEDIYVVVASYNDKAINFYKRFGFMETGKQIEDASAKASGDKEIPEIEMVLRTKT